MPIIAATIIRYIVITIVQLGIVALIDKYVLPLLNRGIAEIMETFGVPEETAKDIMANEIIELAENVGIFALVLSTKMPVKVAERLGFTTKGYAKRTLGTATKEKVAAGGKTPVSKTVTTPTEAAKIAEVVAKARGISSTGFSNFARVITLVIGLPTGFFFALAQYIDFANWQGPYQKFFQRLISNIGINPDSPMPRARVVSTDIWTRIYATIEELGPIGIYFPFSGRSVPYSRLELANLIDEVAANIVKEGGSASYKNVIGAALPLIQLKTQTRTDADVDKIFAKYIPVTPTPSGGTGPVTGTKVFTGIVSQGVVGQGLVFTPRPDDMIESVEELRQAAANNLAPYLTALLGKIVYEVKIVSSIITRDGFRQTGTTQRIQTGSYANGTPRYKTVTNKFATLVVYALTDKGSRTKLTTIVLGPTNSAKLLVAQNDLRTIETQLPESITTTDINEIKGIETSTPVTVSPPPKEPAATQKIDYTAVLQNADRVWGGIAGAYRQGAITRLEYGKLAFDLDDTLSDVPLAELQKQRFYNDLSDAVREYNALQKETGGKTGTTTKGEPAPSPAPTKPTTTAPKTPAPVKKGSTATTLYEWYQAQGKSLPSVSTRAKLYESMGLGKASYYTGTAEQNTKLLKALKAS